MVREQNLATQIRYTLPEGDHWPLAIGEGLYGFTGNNYETGNPKIQSVPWLGNIAEIEYGIFQEQKMILL